MAGPFFVDGAVGNDSNAGTAEGSGNAWLTINKAATTAAAGEIVNIKASATYTVNAQTFTNSGNSTSGPILYRGYTTTPGANDGRPTVTSTTSTGAIFSLNAETGICFRHLKFTHSGATRGPAFLATGADSTFISIADCEFDGCSYAVLADFVTNFTFRHLQVDRCSVLNSTQSGFYVAGETTISNTYIKSSTNYGIYKQRLVYPLHVLNCVIRDCAKGLYINCDSGTTNTGIHVFNTAFYNQSAEAIYKQDSQIQDWSIMNCVFHSNSYAVRMGAGKVTECINLHNAYGTATNANVGWGAGTGDQTLSGDPWTNVSTPDFSPDNTANEGQKLRSLGYPGVTAFGTGYADIGPLRHQDPAGGGAGIAVLTGGGLAR